MVKILVVEDDDMINQVVTEFLKEKGYEVVSVKDGEQALEEFDIQQFDLLLLDIMLPSIGGVDILKKVRETSNVPVVMLTAIDDEYTQLVSFNHMINDYIVKPFSPVILVKRIENVLRLNRPSTIIEIGGYSVNLEDCIVIYEGKEILLTKKEYEILAVLAKRAGNLVTREQLVYQVWGYDDYLDSRILDNHMKNLRKKLPYLAIQTVKGMGYKIEVTK
jgi:two-component system response regulator Irr